MPASKTSLNDLLYDIRRIAEHREILTDKKIKQIYSRLTEDLTTFLSGEYIKYADKEGRLYVSYLDSQNRRARFLQEVVNNVDGIGAEIRKEMLELIDDTYSTSYSGMLEAFKKAEETGKFAEIVKDINVRPEVIKQAIKNNISKLTLPAVLEKNRQELIYQIQQTLTTGLMNGDRYTTMARALTERVKISEGKAMRIVRTEVHRNIESGYMDCAEHIQEGLEGSELIYAAVWRTMKDEKVRPQKRVKTKKGWKTVTNKNGANHVKMHGVTVKAGELFDLGDGAKAKAPSQSGVAAHDCNCRCYVRYKLMTIEQFAQATKQTPEEVKRKYFNRQ